MTDGELIYAIRRGRHGAFETLYRRHKDAVFRFACALGGSVVDGEDLLQEAFLGLLKNIDGFDAGRPVAPYLLRSVRSRHIDKLRSFAGRGRPLPEDDLLASRDGSTDLLVEKERRNELQRALDSLSQEQRDVLTLRVFGGLGYDDIAEEQEVPRATVRTRYRAAIVKLRQLLGKRVTNE